MNKIRTSTFLLIIFTLSLNVLKAQEKAGTFYVTLPGSRLWFEGTSTVNDFTCQTGDVDGYAEITNASELKPGVKRKVKVSVSIGVRTLDCGNKIMNKDMYKAMKADEFREIRYELVYARLSSKRDSSKRIILHALGNVIIAGKKKLVNIKVAVEKLLDGNLRLTGNFPISMLDYGITPPQHLLGIIKAHEKLIVYFDLIVADEKSHQKVPD